ncbi:hypothetical protein QYF36_020868 [Acer negundo]|nr:hypothetical protein QYF36_020868 [Acer negundo]
MATCSPGDCLILPRNSHKSAISTLVLSGAIPKYIIPQYNYDWDIASGVLPSQAFNKGKCVGTVVCKMGEHRTTYRGYIAMLVVINSYHGRGIGNFS